MDFTARMMRRTLLCAVFACALAALSLPAAFALQAACALIFACAGGERAPLWPRGASAFSARGGRALYCAMAGIALGALLYRASLFARPQGAWAYGARVLCALSAHLTQCALFARVKRAGRARCAACLLFCLLVIACMR